MSKILITGMGVISAIGRTVEENRASLMNGFCGISQIELFASKYAGRLPVGEIKIATNDLKTMLNAHEFGVTRTSLLALHALNEAIADSGLTAGQLQSKDTALIGATTVGGMCLTDELYLDANAGSAGSEYLASYDYGSVSIYLQERLQVGGIVNTFNTACSSSANAILYGARLLQHGYARRCIVGGVDSLAKFTINGFNALHILSPDICAPFDKDRRGLNLGEGAGFLVLEKEDDIGSKKVYASLSGFSNANDAFHPSSLSAEGNGPFLSMKGALDHSGLQPTDISFINAHGTGTENNDESESRAMIRLFGEPPAFSSTKSNTGHTLGAAGALEAVYSILNLDHQELYPAVQFNAAIPETGLVPVAAYGQANLQHVMSNSFGFGGNCTSLIFSKS